MPEKIPKSIVLISLEDVLVPYKVINSIPERKRDEVLSSLSRLEAEGKIRLILVSGLTRDVLEKKLEEYSLSKFFKPGNIFSADQKYIRKRAEIDRQRHAKEIRENPEYSDEYIKVQVVEELLGKGTPKESIIFFGHDLLADAYYLYRYCGIDIALIKNALSFRNQRTSLVKDLIYLNFNWPEFRKVIYGRKKAKGYASLEARVLSDLKRELFGKTIVMPVALSKRRQN